MKKGHGLDRALHPIAYDQLQCIRTPALLARLKRLRWCEERRADSDLSDEEVAWAAGRILFKDSAAWHSAYDEVRKVLAGRDHIDRR